MYDNGSSTILSGMGSGIVMFGHHVNLLILASVILVVGAAIGFGIASFVRSRRGGRS